MHLRLWLASFALLACGKVEPTLNQETEATSGGATNADTGGQTGSSSVGGAEQQAGSSSVGGAEQQATGGAEQQSTGGANSTGGSAEEEKEPVGMGFTPPPSGCEDFVGGATPEQVAQTYMERPIAEILALDVMGPEDFVVQIEDYERIVADLDAMQEAHPEVPALFLGESLYIVPIPRWGAWNRVRITFTEVGQDQIRAGGYDAWDCLNWWYQVSEIDTKSISNSWVDLTFDGYYNLPLVLEEYAALAEIKSVKVYRNIGVESDICVSFEGDISTYLFWHGLGDCPAGCGGEEYWGFRVGSAEAFGGMAGAPSREEPYERVVEYLGFVAEGEPSAEWADWTEVCY